MLEEFTVRATYAVVSPDQRYFTKSKISNIPLSDIDGEHHRNLAIHGHSFQWVIIVSKGYRIVIETYLSCVTNLARLCDGPGIRQCHNIKESCQKNKYQLEYFIATINIYSKQIMSTSSNITFRASLVATNITVTSPLTLQVVSRPSAIMHKSFQLITDRAIQINFDIRNFSGFNNDNCAVGGMVNLNCQCTFLLQIVKQLQYVLMLLQVMRSPRR